MFGVIRWRPMTSYSWGTGQVWVISTGFGPTMANIGLHSEKLCGRCFGTAVEPRGVPNPPKVRSPTLDPHQARGMPRGREPPFAGISPALAISTESAKRVDMSRRANIDGLPPPGGVVDMQLAFHRHVSSFQSLARQ